MSFPCPRCEGAGTIPGVCYYGHPPYADPCPDTLPCEECELNPGLRACEECGEPATAAVPLSPTSRALCYFCGTCAPKEDGRHQADVDRAREHDANKEVDRLREERHLPGHEL